jgi:NAD(P)-dependent dehydrogenase (short-subunit alcohol dehydrogenase family)
MGALDGRIAVITGAGRGLGRAHAHCLAAEGARVVVNDLEAAPAEEVVAEVRAAGGEAVTCVADVSTWDGGRAVVDAALETWGDLHVLVNNAGIIRDRTIVSMDEADWDDVVGTNLKGTFAPTHWAATHWRARSKAGDPVSASIVNTSSTSGLLGNPGQSNYGVAKAGVAVLTVIAAQELAKYGVRVNAIVPAARTRMTENAPGLGEIVQAPAGGFDSWDPANASPLVAYLGTAGATETGCVYLVQGGQIRLFQPWSLTGTVERSGRWTIGELAGELPRLMG